MQIDGRKGAVMKKHVMIAILIAISFLNINIVNALPEVRYNYFIVNNQTVALPMADVVFDGEKVNSFNAGVDPVIIESRTLVPVRFLSEKMNYKVGWDGENQKVTIEKNNKKIELFIGKNIAIIGGIQQQMTDSVPPIVVNEKTMVPIRFVVEQFGMDIDYDVNTNQVLLSSNSVKDVADILFEEEKSQPKKELPTTNTAEISENTRMDNSEISEDIYKMKNKITYKNIDDDEKTVFEIRTTGNDVEYSHFVLQEPTRLVIDVKNSVINSSQKPTDTFTDSFFTSLNSAYHSDGDYTRLVLTLDDKNQKDNINLTKEDGDIIINLKKPLNAGNIVVDSGRLKGSITIKLERPYELTSDTGDNINLVIPKDVADFSLGEIVSENNFVKNLTVESNYKDYIIYGDIKERASYNFTKINDKTYQITFDKYVANPPMIVLDAGHGGKDPGAISSDFNIDEKTLNLQVLFKLKNILEQRGYQVYTTRESDFFIELNDIAEIANDYNPDIFVSIHHNAYKEKPSVNGIETYYYSDDSKNLASTIQKHMITASGATDRGAKAMGYVVIKKTYMPAVLLELGFMTNYEEIQKNMTEDYQYMLSYSIADGIDEYFNR